MARLTDIAAIILFAAMFLCVLAQVFFRYFLGNPLVWSDELSRYLFVWVSFLGWVIAARKRSHLTVSVFDGRLGPRGRAVLKLVGAVAAILFAVLLAWQGWRIAMRNMDVETTTLAVSAGVIYLIVPVAAILVGLYAASDLVRAVRVFAGREA